MCNRYYISEEVNKLFTKCNINPRSDIPADKINDLISILKKHYNTKIYTLEDQFLYDISGRLEQDEDGFRIYLNMNENIDRMRFTLLNEVAHIILHRDKWDFDNTKHSKVLFRRKSFYSRNLDSSVEKDANIFAAQFLMPKGRIEETFNKYIESYSNQNIIASEMANKYHVSNAAMKYRLHELGLSV